MTEQITPRPTRIHRTDYRQLGLVFGAAFLGTLLALGLLMLFGKMLVKKQMKDLEKMGEPVQPPKNNEPKTATKPPIIIQETEPEWEIVAQFDATKTEKVELPISQQLADTNDEKKVERGKNGKFIKREPIIINP